MNDSLGCHHGNTHKHTHSRALTHVRPSKISIFSFTIILQPLNNRVLPLHLTTSRMACHAVYPVFNKNAKMLQLELSPYHLRQLIDVISIEPMMSYEPPNPLLSPRVQ